MSKSKDKIRKNRVNNLNYMHRSCIFLYRKLNRSLKKISEHRYNQILKIFIQLTAFPLFIINNRHISLSRELLKKHYEIQKFYKIVYSDFQYLSQYFQIYFLLNSNTYKNIRTLSTNYYYDFRGRIYPVSMLNPVFNKIIRNFFIIKEAEDFQKLYNDIKKSQYYKVCAKYFLKKTIVSKLNIFNKLVLKLSEIDEYIIFNIVLSVGTLNKNKIYQTAGVGVMEFLQEGIDILNSSYESIENIEEKLQVYKFQQELEFFKNSGKWRCFSIIKDSTASTMQHWAIHLGIRNRSRLEQCNLSGER